MTLTSKYDVQYGPNLTLDWYQLANQPAKGIIIDIHGGGWFQGDKAKEADLAQWLAQQGYLVVVPNYRLAPAAHFPAPIADMERLYQWVQTQLPALPVAALGGSAGGNLAVELSIKHGLPAISLSGILDIDHWLATHQAVVATAAHAASADTASTAIDQAGADDSFYKWFISNYLTPDQARAATPYHRVNAQSGPLLLINSLSEFVPTSGVLQLSQQLIQFGLPVETIFLAGTRHAKGYLPDVQANILAFLTRYLG
ncbi:alpha/beta hydrolase fold domain-containing protein [Loigolactobacillus jiayinensis]|uniref:Alpha/beta hydrolase n=1 Tax=Loigolactobacillus jiayinensis TaxID=2486016 RepID=A0ABW1RFT3_9LACO|nr:alpha/beta hydrolase [Loigolactobacillus jiayinensis]